MLLAVGCLPTLSPYYKDAKQPLRMAFSFDFDPLTDMCSHYPPELVLDLAHARSPFVPAQEWMVRSVGDWDSTT